MTEVTKWHYASGGETSLPKGYEWEWLLVDVVVCSTEPTPFIGPHIWDDGYLRKTREGSRRAKKLRKN